MNTINAPIDMVTEIRKDGFIRPIRFRVTAEDGEEHVIKVTVLKHVNEEKINIKESVRKFQCVVIVNEVQKTCELQYNTYSTKWTLVKM